MLSPALGLAEDGAVVDEEGVLVAGRGLAVKLRLRGSWEVVAVAVLGAEGVRAGAGGRYPAEDGGGCWCCCACCCWCC